MLIEDKFADLNDLLNAAVGGDDPDAKDPDNPNPDPAPDPTPTPTPDPAKPDPVPTVPTTPDPANPNPDPNPADSNEGDKGKGKGNPMKEIRDKYNQEKTSREKLSSAIERFTEGEYSFALKDFKVDGKVDYDAFIKAMDDADTAEKAKAKGIAPEVQAEIDRIEQEKVEINKQKLQVAMDRALTNMQQDLSLKSVDINNFFKDAMALKKNPYQWLAQGGDLHDLYRNVYWEKLIKEKTEAAVTAAKATWDEELARSTKAPIRNPAVPNQPTPANNANGLSLDKLLEEALAKKK